MWNPQPRHDTSPVARKLLKGSRCLMRQRPRGTSRSFETASCGTRCTGGSGPSSTSVAPSENRSVSGSVCSARTTAPASARSPAARSVGKSMHASVTWPVGFFRRKRALRRISGGNKKLHIEPRCWGPRAWSRSRRRQPFRLKRRKLPDRRARMRGAQPEEGPGGTAGRWPSRRNWRRRGRRSGSGPGGRARSMVRGLRFVPRFSRKSAMYSW
jgi:hypothetical protein